MSQSNLLIINPRSRFRFKKTSLYKPTPYEKSYIKFYIVTAHCIWGSTKHTKRKKHTLAKHYVTICNFFLRIFNLGCQTLLKEYSKLHWTFDSRPNVRRLLLGFARPNPRSSPLSGSLLGILDFGVSLHDISHGFGFSNLTKAKEAF